MVRRRVKFEHTVSGTNVTGTATGTFGGDGVMGEIVGCSFRWEQTSGAGSLTNLQVVAQSRRHGTAVTVATVKSDAKLYDSGVVAAPSSSSTAAVQTDTFHGADGDAQAFADGFDSLSGYSLVGAVVGTLTVVYDVETSD